MRHIPQIGFTGLLVLFCTITTTSRAETAATEPATEQQQLQSILKKLDHATKQRQQQSAHVDTLSQRLECNWTLIRAYDVCGQLHKDDPQEHLRCSTIAKQNAARCLKNSGKK